MLQNPIVVDVVKQPPPAHDISIDVIVGMFTMTGVILLAAAVGALLTGGAFVLFRRWRDAAAPPADTGHNTLRIQT